MMAVMTMIFTAIVWLSIWGYRTFFQPLPEPDLPRLTADTLAPPVSSEITNDTFDFATSDTLLIHADSLTDFLRLKLTDLERLQNEIRMILEQKEHRKDSLAAQPDSLAFLLAKLDSLESLNRSVEEENLRLKEKLESINKQRSRPEPKDKPTKQPVKNTTPPGASRITQSVFVSGLSVYGLSGDKSVTRDAKQTTALQLTFLVKAGKAGHGDLFIVITRPDGKVLSAAENTPSAFRAGTARTPYSKKVSFDSSNQWINLVEPVQNLRPGTYTISVYSSNGIMIARLKKSFT